MIETTQRVIHSTLFASIIIVLSMLLLFIQADRRYGYTSSEPKEYTNIASDGTGYYAYLPQYFVYPNQKNFSFHREINSRYPDKAFFSMLSFDPETGQLTDKFYVGTALLQAPFYALGHVVASASGQADGYSLPYRLSIQLAALFYWLIGSIALLRLFGRMGYRRFPILLGIVLITFGTNLNLYTAHYVSMSHVYSFAMIACFLNVMHHWSKNGSVKSLLWGCLLFGLIGIIRPVNVLILVMVPFFFASFGDFRKRVHQLFVQHRKVVFIGIVLIWVPVLIQLLIHHDQTGRWSLYTYEKEGFDNLFSPQFFNVLFSYEKGFFVYAPVMLLLFPGVFFLFRNHSRYFVLGWMFTALITLYFICSWWSWDYGGGLGMRPLIDFFPLYLAPLLALFQHAPKLVNITTAIVVIAGIYLYQVYQVQFSKNILLYSEMNKDRFWQVFMKTDDRYKWMLAYDYQQLPEGVEQVYNQISLTHEGWETPKGKTARLTLHGNELEWPFYARFTGTVTVHDQANNPTLEIAYYRDGNLISVNTQPFGNQIDVVNAPTLVKLEFNPKMEYADSITLFYLPNGKKNTLKNTRLQLLKHSINAEQ